MPKNRKKLPEISLSNILKLIDKSIQHKLFKPVALSIIVSFILFNIAAYVQNFIADYRDNSQKIATQNPIKINIDKTNLNIDDSQEVEHVIAAGDTIGKILTDIGTDEKDAFEIAGEIKKNMSFRAINVGSTIKLNYKANIVYDQSDFLNPVKRKVNIKSLSINKTVDELIVVERTAGGAYKAKTIKIKLTKKVKKYSGTINNSLYVDGVAAGVSANSMINMINLYGYDVDFQRDIHDGDKFEVLVESYYDEDGKKVKDGVVLFSSLTLSGRAINIYMHRIKDSAEYFDAKGNSVRKSLLRTPVNGARISSGFGLRRHPILGYSKMHKGTDFAAPTGTPILAAGSGTIVYRAVKGGYGNYVQIKHNSDYSTAYGHASRFGKFRVGSKVKQGDVVAYIGTTGRSTGPHLHFEVLYRGKQVNPSKVKATSGLRLGGAELDRFRRAKAEIDNYRAKN